ncbi:helix-turn-helix transcriptional regulator [Turicimonas muris]
MEKLILRKKDVAPLIGRTVRTLNRWIAEGFFPKGKYVKGAMAWTMKDIENWQKTLPTELSEKYSA